MSVEIEMERKSSVAGFSDDTVQGLQYRRGSRKLSFTGLSSTGEIKPVKLTEEDVDDSDAPEIFKEELVAYAPDGGYGWVIVLASFLSNFVLDGISLSQAPLMNEMRKASSKNTSLPLCPPELEDDLTQTNCTVPEVTVALYNVISSVLLCVTLCAGPFVSLLTDRFGFRKVGILGSLLASLGLFLSWVVSPTRPNIYAIIVFFGGISGLGFGMMFQASIVIVGIYFERWRPLATGIAVAGTGAGVFAFPKITEAAVEAWGWGGTYILLSCIALFSVCFALLYRPLPMKTVKQAVQPQKRRPSFPDPQLEKQGLSSVWKSMGTLIVSPTFLLISISGGITMLGFFAPYAFLKDTAEKGLGIPGGDATYLISIIGIANTIGRLVFGLISCHPWINHLILSNSALTLTGIATFLLPLLTQYYQLVLYSIVFGFGIAIFTVLRSILLLKFMGMDKFNNAFGLSLFFMGAGTLIGNPLGGWLYDRTKSYAASFYAAGAYLAISAILCYPLQWVRDWENRREEYKTSKSNPRKSLF